MRHFSWAFLIVLSAAMAFGLTSCGRSRTTTVLVLFDISKSTSDKQIRQSYLKDLTGKVLPSVQPGTRLLGDVISQNSLASASLPIHVAFPAHSRRTTNSLRRKAQMKKASETATKKVTELVMSAKAGATDLMNSLQLADKLFNGEGCKGDARKVLIIFSDTIEQSGDYDFTGERLTDERIDEIIKKERESGRLPDLRGVTVWVTGANASLKGKGQTGKFYEVQRFWIRYLKECGASLTKPRYGATLINFQL